jgi:hypothetical protein
MNGGIINSIKRLHLVGYFSWDIHIHIYICVCVCVCVCILTTITQGTVQYFYASATYVCTSVFRETARGYERLSCCNLLAYIVATPQRFGAIPIAFPCTRELNCFIVCLLFYLSVEQVITAFYRCVWICILNAVSDVANYSNNSSDVSEVFLNVSYRRLRKHCPEGNSVHTVWFILPDWSC